LVGKFFFFGRKMIELKREEAPFSRRLVFWPAGYASRSAVKKAHLTPRKNYE